MDGPLSTSNTPGSMFGITSSGVYSPRLELLQQELASGKYTSMADATSLGREISRVYSGLSGDMQSSGAPSFFDSKASMTPVSKDTVVNGPDTGETALDKIKQWFSEHAMSMLLILIGIVFLFGAFMTWEPTENAAKLAAAAI